MEIGSDIEKIERFRLKKDDIFLKRFFTENEINKAFESESPEVHLAGFFCAKEAVIKTSPENLIDLKKIEIFHDSSGKPFIEIKDELAKKDIFKVSISHSGDYAVANVIRLEKEEF